MTTNLTGGCQCGAVRYGWLGDKSPHLVNNQRTA